MPNKKAENKDPYTWSKNRIKFLYTQVSQWNDTDVTTRNHGLWSVRKLIALDCYIKPLAQIMRKYFKRFFYIDPFSGSGLIEVNGKRFPGSALIPLLRFDNYPFDKYYLSDNDPDFILALKKRVQRVNKGLNCEISVSDYSEIITKLFSGKRPKSWFDTGYLVFLDPYGLKVKWADMERILRSGPIDLLFSFMSGAVMRNKSKAKGSISNYFGDDGWKGLSTHEEYLRYYCAKLNNLGYRTFEIDVAFPGRMRYYLIFASQNEKAGDIFNDIKRKVSSIDNDMLQNAFGVSAGGNMDLDYYQNQPQ